MNHRVLYCVFFCRTISGLFPRYVTVPGKGKLSVSSVLYEEG